MRLEETRVLVGDHFAPITVAQMAELFIGMGSDQQAQFFSCVANIVDERWYSGGLSVQLIHIATSKSLSTPGRKLMADIGRYVE